MRELDRKEIERQIEECSASIDRHRAVIDLLEAKLARLRAMLLNFQKEEQNEGPKRPSTTN
jgi:uncharacterized coiled-coil protein SlyX